MTGQLTSHFNAISKHMLYTQLYPTLAVVSDYFPMETGSSKIPKNRGGSPQVECWKPMPPDMSQGKAHISARK